MWKIACFVYKFTKNALYWILLCLFIQLHDLKNDSHHHDNQKLITNVIFTEILQDIF